MGPTSSILTKAVGLFVALAPMTAHGHPEHVTSKHQRGPLATATGASSGCWSGRPRRIRTVLGFQVLTGSRVPRRF